MKKFTLVAIAALALSAAPAFAADLPVKAKPVVAPEPPAWDLAFGSAIASDYIFRGITQSNHQPSVAAYFEPRYNINKDLQFYAGVGGASISFPNRAAGEVDFYAGVRPTFGPLAFDFGVWYYWYPKGQCFNAIIPGCNGNTLIAGMPAAAGANLPNGNVIKNDLSFLEVYGKVNYTVNDNIVLGAYAYYSPSVLNSGAPGIFFGGTAKYTFTAFTNGVQPYISAEIGRWDLGTSDNFYCTLNAGGTACGGAFPGGIPYKDYNTWNVGFGWTYKVFTVDLRYIDTDLNAGDCNAFTSDQTAIGAANVTPINTGGLGSKWCNARFVARLSADLTLNTNVK